MKDPLAISTEGTLATLWQALPTFLSSTRRAISGMSDHIACAAPAEEWLEIPGYEGKYEVSSLGRVRSLYTGIIRKPGKHRDFYAKLNLCADARKVTFHVHALVALAFLGPRPPGHVIDHINGDHTDDSAANLRYVSASDSNHNRRLRGGSFQSAGHPNVYRHAWGGFFVRVTHKNKQIRLGWHARLDEAIAAAKRFMVRVEQQRAKQKLRNHLSTRITRSQELVALCHLRGIPGEELAAAIRSLIPSQRNVFQRRAKGEAIWWIAGKHRRRDGGQGCSHQRITQLEARANRWLAAWLGITMA